MSSVAFRLTIYQANGTTPDLTVSSIRGGTNPYIVGVPSGDGQEVDLLTGSVRSGAYNVTVADVVTGSDGTGTVRLVTNKLEDASFRQQLLSRRAKLEISRNGGSTWAVWTFGYLTALRQIDAISYGFTVSDSRRIESTHTAFTWSADPSATTDERREFPNRGCLIGGPTIENFGPLRASGGWEYAWKEVQGSYLALAFVAAYNAPSYSRTNTMNVIGFFNALRPFFQSLPPITNLTGANFEQIRERQYVFAFPKVMAIVTSGSSVWYGTVRAAHTPPAPGQNGQGSLALPTFGEMNYLYIELDPGQSTSYPSANATVRVQLLQKEVSAASPLYINEHPVDIATKLYETVNIPFNAASATSIKAIVGDDLRLALRITEPVRLGEFLAQSIFGPFGFSARTNASGEQEFFATRIANSAVPTISITDDDIAGDAPPSIFEVDEASVVTSFRLTAKSLSPFVADPTGSLQAPPDGLVELETSEIVQSGDTSTYSTREVAYKFPGMVHDGSVTGAAFTLSPEVVGRFFTGIVAEGFDRFGRGAIASDVQVLATSSAASLQVGDEVLIDASYYPNKNYRIGESSVGSRIAQIVRRTEAPEGPIFKLIDSGVNAQPTSPTFTLASYAGDPRRVAAVTVTNAATLNSANVTLAVQYQVSANTPTKTGTLYTRFRPGTIPTVAFTLPSTTPGSKVWVRMRTERTEYRASAWTSWTSVTLDSWIAPNSLTVGTTTANSVALSWDLGTPTDNTIDPIDVFAYKGASAPADWTGYRVGSLANGSTSITVRDLDASTQYTFGVAFKDEVSGAYSAFATATTTTNAVNTVTCPNPPKMKVYTSFLDAGVTTGVALAIGAVEGYNIVVERAPDSSGSPGAWKEIALLAPLTPIFVDPLPSDGLTRWYRVFYRLSGFLDGAKGTARSATPIAIPDDLVGQNASLISGGATLTFGAYLVGTPDSFYDGATSQSLAVDATSAATANKVVARDNTGSFSANTVTATLDGPAPAGQLTGSTLAANVLSSSLTSVGTIGTGVWQGTSVGKNYGGTGLTSTAFAGITNERVFAYDGASGSFFIAPSGSNGQALVYSGGALAWGNPAPGSHVLADTTGLGSQHTTSGLTAGMILQATGATTARFQTPSIPASSVTAGTFSGTSYTITNDLTVSGTLTASLPFSSITSTPTTLAGYGITDALPLAGGTLTGKVVFPSAIANRPQLPQGFIGLDTGDGNFDIWGISRDYYPSNPTAANAWGIRWDGDSNQIRFIGADTIRLAVDLDGGNSGLTWETNVVLHAGNYNSYSPKLDGTGAVNGAWTINTTGTAANVTGTVAIANGGTNKTSYTTSGTGTRVAVYDQGTGAFDVVSAGTSGQFLRSSGTTGDVSWATPPNFTASAAGYAPASGGGTTTFLRADGTWATVPATTTIAASGVTAGTFPGASYTFTDSLKVNTTLSFDNSLGNKIDYYYSATGTGDRYGVAVQSAELRIYSGQAGAASGGITFGKAGTSSFTENIRFTNDGKVGIGTSAPDTQLHIKNSSIAYQIIEAGSTYAYLQLKTPTQGSGYLIKNLATGNSAIDRSLYLYNSDGPIQFVPNATIANAVNVTSNGRLSIGTVTPSTRIHVAQDDDTRGLRISQTLATSYAEIQLAASAREYRLGVGGGSVADVASEFYLYDQNATSFRLVVDTSGRVGIGTATPSDRLHVAGGGIFDSSLYIGTTSSYNGSTFEIRKNGIWDGPCITLYQTGTSGQAWSLFSTNTSFSQGAGKLLIYNGTGAGDVAVFDSSGRMGIGTMNPGYRLDVSGSFHTNNEIYIDNGNYLRFQRSSGGLSIQTLGIESGTDNVRLLTTGDLNIANGSLTNLVVVKNGGNVGIGTTNPQAKLAVQLDGTASSTINLYNNNGTNLRYSEIRSWFSPTDSSHTASIRFLKDVSVSGNYGSAIGFVTEADAGSQSIDYAMYIKNRNVGIGTTAPGQKLHVEGQTLINTGSGASDFRDLMLGGISGWTGNEAHGIEMVYNTAASPLVVGRMDCQYVGPQARLRFGRLYYGATSSTYTMTLTATSTTTADLSVSGTVTATDFILSSDRRKKAELEVIEDALAKVKQLVGYTYRPIDGERRRAGLMAQEVEAVAPEPVYTDDEGWKSLSYEQMIPYLVEAIKTLDKKIEALA